MPYGIANTSGQPDFNEIASIIGMAAEHGVWAYDTGQSYGDSERLLGKAFSELKINDRVRCITKIHPDINSRDFRKPIMESIRQSIEKLQTPRLWALLAHRVEQTRDPGVLEAVNQAKDEGLLKFWGVSVYHPGDAMACLKDPSIDIIQAPFNILDRRLLDLGFFDAAKDHGKKVMIRSVFLQGLLFMSSDELFAKGVAWAIPWSRDFRGRFDALDAPLESFALQAVSRKVSQSLIIVGVEKASQLSKNIGSFRSPVIPGDIIDAWWRALPVYSERLLNPSKW